IQNTINLYFVTGTNKENVRDPRFSNRRIVNFLQLRILKLWKALISREPQLQQNLDERRRQINILMVEGNGESLIGKSYEDRFECRQWGVHFPHVAGIAGQSKHALNLEDMQMMRTMESGFSTQEVGKRPQW
ncbi:hypothetical protein MKW98_007424, partial [Papaver atlanticum]